MEGGPLQGQVDKKKNLQKTLLCCSLCEGAFTYYSYRDPNSLDTFSVFNQSADWVLGDNFGQPEVEEAVLRVFQVEQFTFLYRVFF